MKKLLIGTTNLAKFNDYNQLLKEFNLEVVSLHEYGKELKNPIEDGLDYESNAVLKAKYYFQKTGIPTLSDDGGFEIKALKGEPGLKSHRWVGKNSTDRELVDKVFEKMKKVPEGERQCLVRIVIAVASPFGVFTAEGKLEGVVPMHKPKKIVEGFPFTSSMYFPNYRKNYVDMTKKERDILNHRHAAIEKIKDIFIELSK